MRRRLITATASLLLALVLGVFPAYAHDAEYGMRNGEQNGLLLGVVEEAGEDWVVLKDVKALPAAGVDGTIYRQLPPEEVPDSVKVTDIREYNISYNGYTKPEAGQVMFVSADRKENGDWTALWSPYEVSSTDPATLEFLPEGKKTLESVAWEEFVHSGGKHSVFSYDYGGEKEQLWLDIYDEGTRTGEHVLLFEREPDAPRGGAEAAESVVSRENAGMEAQPERSMKQHPLPYPSPSDMPQPSPTDTAQPSPTDTAQSQPFTATSMVVILTAVAIGIFGGLALSRRRRRRR